MLRQVLTENGWVRGLPAADPRITSFKGIPFAAPPVGDLRWRAPQPAESWEGVRDCYTFGPIAMQETPGGDPTAFYSKEWHVDPQTPMSEDCLYLNVWTPAKSPEEKLPVMFWIFGGGLQCGYPSEMEFDGERLARRGVVVVSVNYRVNVFGFFSHPEITAAAGDEPAANFGLLDQRAGMLWVRRNIAAFGGDPDNVLIFGQSAGGGSVLSHLVSPMDEGLFHRAVVQSAGGVTVTQPRNMFTNGYPTLEEAQQWGVEFFRFLGVETLEEARRVDAETLLAKHFAFNERHRWGFTLEEKFLPEHPSDAIRAGRMHQVPVMVGNTAREFPVGPASDDPETVAAWCREQFGSHSQEYLALCREEAARTGVSLREAATVNSFQVGADLFCRILTDAGRKNIYYYRFDPEIPGDDAGSFHSSDLWFVFETLGKCWRPFTGKHYDLARQMCNYWTAFAKAGDPNCTDADGTEQPHWAPYHESHTGMAFEDACVPSPSVDQDPRRRLLIDINL